MIQNLTYLQTATKGEQIEFWALLENIELKTARNGSPYLLIRLQDRRTSVSSSVFDNGPVFTVMKNLKPGVVLHLLASADYYDNKPAPRISGLNVLPPDHPDYVRACDQVMATSEFGRPLLEQLLNKYLSAIADTNLRSTVRQLVEACPQLWEARPSVASHRPYRYGLVEYILTCCSDVEAITRGYKGMDTDVVLAALMCYSLGRAELDSMGESRTVESVACSAVIRSYDKFKAAAKAINPLKAMAVEHAILSTGTKGGIKPATREAILVNFLLDMHEALGVAQQAITAAPEGQLLTLKVEFLGTPLIVPQTKAEVIAFAPPPPPPAT